MGKMLVLAGGLVNNYGLFGIILRYESLSTLMIIIIISKYELAHDLIFY